MKELKKKEKVKNNSITYEVLKFYILIDKNTKLRLMYSKQIHTKNIQLLVIILKSLTYYLQDLIYLINVADYLINWFLAKLI